MKSALTRAAWLLLAYLVAGAALLMVLRWPDWAGHAHVPFSGFPGFLVWTPVAPVMAVLDFGERPVKAAAGLIVFVGVFTAVMAKGYWRKPPSSGNGQGRCR